MEETQVPNGDSTPQFSYETSKSSNKSEWRSDSIKNLITSLSQFQGDLGTVSKDKTNPFFNSSYADINAILEAVRPVLSKHGLAISQGFRFCLESNGFYVTTLLGHKSGEWMTSEVRMPIGGKKDAQAVGSSCTYGRRYGLSAILGISVDDDDDGNAAIRK